MRFEGILSAWNHDAGYGTIRPVGGGEEVFVSLSAFPTDGDGPRLDEPLSFEIVTGRDGRKQAVNLKRMHPAHPNPALREVSGATRLRMRQVQKRRRLTVAAGAAVAVVLALGSAHWLQRVKAGDVQVVRR
jgi:cold shock CspA family protein